MKTVHLYDRVGDFGEDKDAASTIRKAEILPEIEEGKIVEVDFEGVTLVTQSFIHALISDILRTKGEDVLEMIIFANCVEVVRGIISTVVQYSLDSIDIESPELPM